jgi:hypothetical protein
LLLEPAQSAIDAVKRGDEMEIATTRVQLGHQVSAMRSVRCA